MIVKKEIVMTEHDVGVNKGNKPSLKSLGVMILVISTIELVVTTLLFTQENTSYIFVITQNVGLFVFSIVIILFSNKIDSTPQFLEIKKRKMFLCYFAISLVVGFIGIILYITKVPIPQPKFDEKGVSIFYGMLTILNGVTILNLIVKYLGVRKYKEWQAIHQIPNISREMNFGILFSIAALVTYFVANLPLLDAAIKIESYANPIDPSVFTIHFLIAIALIFLALGFLFIGMTLEVLSGYELLKINNQYNTIL